MSQSLSADANKADAQPAQPSDSIKIGDLKKPERLPKPGVSTSTLPRELIDGLHAAAKQYKPTEEITVSCGFFGDKRVECINALTKIATGDKSEDDAYTAIDTLITGMADKKVDVNSIIADVKQMSPDLVASVLANLGFKTVKKTQNIRGVDVDILVIEEVSEWDKRRKNPHGQNDDAEHLGGQRGGDPTVQLGVELLLEIFREWVNANPSTLNPELNLSGKKAQLNQNEVDKSFNLYDRRNPQLAMRLSDYKSGLKRINLGIASGYAGYTPSLYTNIPTSMAFAQSLNPELFFNAKLTGLPAMIQSGGDDGENFKEFEKNVFENSGSFISLNEVNEFFNKILKANEGAIKLSANSRKKINDALDKLEKGEKELKESYTRFLARKRIYEASNGTVKIEDDDNNVAMDKINQYSNYLKRAEMVNKQTRKVTAMLYNLADSITVLITNPKSQVTLQ